MSKADPICQFKATRLLSAAGQQARERHATSGSLWVGEDRLTALPVPRAGDSSAATAGALTHDSVPLHIDCAGTIGNIRAPRKMTLEAGGERAHIWSKLLATHEEVTKPVSRRDGWPAHVILQHRLERRNEGQASRRVSEDDRQWRRRRSRCTNMVFRSMHGAYVLQGRQRCADLARTFLEHVTVGQIQIWHFPTSFAQRLDKLRHSQTTIAGGCDVCDASGIVRSFWLGRSVQVPTTPRPPACHGGVPELARGRRFHEAELERREKGLSIFMSTRVS